MVNGRNSRVLLTGATGFIGSAVHHSLIRAGLPAVRRLIRGDVPTGLAGPARPFRGDLTDPASLRGSCDDIDVIVHAASHVGADARRCREVNHLGTCHLLAEAARADVRHVIYISTAAVYGAGPHRGLTEGIRDPAPVSPTSASRAAAEAEVLARGGTVLRPHLVYGSGDRWVVPTLAALLGWLPGWIDGGRPRLSMIGVHDLARLVVALVVTPAPPGTVYHANHPDPVTVHAAGEALARHLGVRLPTGDVRATALADLTLPPGLRRRHLDLISMDHWYDSDRLWAATGCRPGAAFPNDLARATQWYPDLARAASPTPHPGADTCD
ncbi:NAD-dependent epimerase/dehydratase family protein [Micromonospora sp. NPDC005172]|uniref:NAD-dependent epimerase/dehydratase family protein n=1 Tax=Micromonospora sp. NPDC005172 TaxID=3156867 RepID=UPI0033BB064D